MTKYFLHPDSVRKLFDSVAPRYDFLNHLLSLRRDISWRREAALELNGVKGWILDIATGTGDVAIEIVRQHPERKVFGIDFSEPMIRGAHRKIVKKDLFERIALSLGDAIFLPFRDNTFHATLIAFGLRNILDKEQALSEMVRVVKEGGAISNSKGLNFHHDAYSHSSFSTVCKTESACMREAGITHGINP